MIYRCYLQVEFIESNFLPKTMNNYLCVLDDYYDKVWQSQNEFGPIFRFGPSVWFPVGWQK